MGLCSSSTKSRTNRNRNKESPYRTLDLSYRSTRLLLAGVHELLGAIADYNIAQAQKAIEYDIDAVYMLTERRN